MLIIIITIIKMVVSIIITCTKPSICFALSLILSSSRHSTVGRALRPEKVILIILFDRNVGKLDFSFDFLH